MKGAGGVAANGGERIVQKLATPAGRCRAGFAQDAVGVQRDQAGALATLINTSKLIVGLLYVLAQHVNNSMAGSRLQAPPVELVLDPRPQRAGEGHHLVELAPSLCG